MLLASCVVLLLIMTTCMLHYLPREVAMIVVSWAMLSISVGISFRPLRVERALND